MKSLNNTTKALLATAVAAASFGASAELKPMDDSSMGNVTGQAGVTIELETRISLGEFRYTDEGSLSVKNIEMGGGGVTDDGLANGQGEILDDLKIDIDIAADGDAVIQVSSLSGNPRDSGTTFSSAELVGTGGQNTVLISNFQSWGFNNGATIRIDTATDTLSLVSNFTVEDMDFDVPFLALGIQDLTINGAGYDNGADPAAEFANISLSLFKGDGLGASAKTDVLRLSLDTFSVDVGIGGVLVGGTSIGTVALDNLTLTNTEAAIYGHD